MTELHVEAASPLLTLSPTSPSFNSYSSANLADIAVRVVREIADEEHMNNAGFYTWEEQGSIFGGENQEMGFLQNQGNDRVYDNYDGKDDDDDEFEFAFEVNSSPISADEIFLNGQIRPLYAFHNNEDVKQSPPPTTVSSTENKERTTKPGRRPPLMKLFNEERESSSSTTTTTSCSSSEADELETVPAGTYCVWEPKKAAAEGEELSESAGRCKKSNSTGGSSSSSKRWNLRDLIHRSNSDGGKANTLVYMTSATESRRREEGARSGNENYKVKGKEGNGAVLVEHYLKNRAIKEGDKRRSFLPYRQDLVGFFL